MGKLLPLVRASRCAFPRVGLITVLLFPRPKSARGWGREDRLERRNSMAKPGGTKMNRRFLMIAAAAGVTLPAAAQAQDLTKPVATPVELPWKVNCHGLA